MKTKKFRYPKSGEPRKFWTCPHWEDQGCEFKCGAHPDGKPSSTPATPELAAARRATHRMMDAFMESEGIDSESMYEMISGWLGVEDAHIGYTELDDCLVVQCMIRNYGQRIDHA